MGAISDCPLWPLLYYYIRISPAVLGLFARAVRWGKFEALQSCFFHFSFNFR
jgi:hypothetical protein